MALNGGNGKGKAAPRAKKTVEKPVEVQKVIEPVVEVEEKRKVVDRDDWVTIMNYTTGSVFYTSRKTGQELNFTEFGQTDEVQVGDLITMKNAHPRYLNEPWIVVLDVDVANYLGLGRIYENLLDADEMLGVFNLPAKQFEELLNKAPRGMIETIVRMAVQKIENQELDSISIIRAIEKVAGIELQV